MSETTQARVVVPFLIVTAIWGSTWLVIKDQISAVPPGWTVTWRFLLASVGMLVLALVRRDSLRLSRSGLIMAAIVGVAQFCGNFQFVYRAEAYLTSGIVAVCYALLLVPNAVLGRIFLKEPISGRFVAGSVVALGGIALLVLHEYRDAAVVVGHASSHVSGHIALGVLFTALGLLCASSANILQATRLGRQQEPVPLLAWAMGFGTLANAALSLALHGAPVLDPRPAYLAGVAYLAIFGSVVTFPLYFMLIRTLGAGRASYNSVAVPVVAMALSTLFEGYRWTGLAVGGAVLALAGLTIALSDRIAPSRRIARRPSRKVG